MIFLAIFLLKFCLAAIILNTAAHVMEPNFLIRQKAELAADILCALSPVKKLEFEIQQVRFTGELKNLY